MSREQLRTSSLRHVPREPGLPSKRVPVVSLASVTAHALATFGSAEKANHWMNRRNPLFNGKTPSQVVKVDPIKVEAELVRIDHGVYM